MNWYLTVLKKYAEFNGRARRSEYWMFALFNALFAITAIIIDNVLGTVIKDMGYGVFYILYSLAVIIPTWAVTTRRLHDIGKSGWWILISLIPIIGGIWLFSLTLEDSEQGENEYGLNPKEVPLAKRGAKKITTVSKLKIPGAIFWFLWMMANSLACYLGTIPFEIESFGSIAGIPIWLTRGVFSGIFQWLLLISIIPKANRWRLALWIPASMLGWEITYVLSGADYGIHLSEIEYEMSNIFLAISVGVLQWLILQKHSKLAPWWIPSVIIDFVVNSFLWYSIYTGINDVNIASFLIGMVGSIASSIGIVFILKKSPYLGEIRTRVVLENPQQSFDNALPQKPINSSQSPSISQDLVQTTGNINLRSDLLEAELALANNDRKSAAILIDKILKQDYVNPAAWQMLYQLLGNGKEFPAFQKDFTSKYYPDKVHLLSK